MNDQLEKINLRKKLLFVLAPLVALVHLYFNTIGIVSGLWQNSFHFASFLVLAGLIHPYQGWGSNRVMQVIDFSMVLLAACAALLLIYSEDDIYNRGIHLTKFEMGLIVFVIIMAIEFTRRITGWVIPVLIIISLSYVSWLGKYIDGALNFSGLSFETILFRSIFSDEALFGSIAEISSTFVFMFVLFGAFLIRSGGGDFIIGLAQSLSGRLVGGPGFVALFASALTGTISGSAVANAASTGVITIPLMKRSGFRPQFAAGIEAAASTGGQLMPPIMGAGAFVMSSFTQIPYSQIVVMSILPAVIYFASIGFYIRFEAKKLNLLDAGKGRQTVMELLMSGGWAFILPLMLLIGMLASGYTPTFAAGYSIISIVVFSWLTKNRMGLKAVWEALEMGAKNMVLTAIVLCSVGLIVNTIAMTGLGNTFSLMISQWSQGNLLIALLLVTLASLVLGMGLPVTASYIILGTLSAPVIYQLILNQQLISLIVEQGIPDSLGPILMLTAPEQFASLDSVISPTQAGELLALVPPELLSSMYEQVFPTSHLTLILLASHLIIFWLSQDSNVTPPVCLVAFTTAAIAGTKFMRTGFEAWKISKALYLVPFLMAYSPLVYGEVWEMLRVTVFALFAMYALSSAFQGYMERHLTPAQRMFNIVAGLSCIIPGTLLINYSGIVLIIAFIIWQKVISRREITEAVTS